MCVEFLIACSQFKPYKKIYSILAFCCFTLNRYFLFIVCKSFVVYHKKIQNLKPIFYINFKETKNICSKFAQRIALGI